MAYEDTAKSAVQQAMDQGRNAAGQAGQTVKDGYRAAQQFAEDKGLNLDVGDFVRREPWLAIAGAFAIGYVAAQMIRRMS
ncbi:MAG: hypothetical protein IVW54_09685 [Candidatus Binataceae bacterium]|nr:hypothetical protein [Candidatus Binataceae bacterium]